MTRVEENKEQIENLLNKEEQLLSNPFAGAFEPAMVLKTTLITSLLIDISKSLALQSDAAIEANKIKKCKDGVPPLIIPDKEKTHGHWVETASPTGSIWECSECGDDVSEQDTFIFSFCPFCGADMREVKNDD
jgi:hypothetical protein